MVLKKTVFFTLVVIIVLSNFIIINNIKQKEKNIIVLKNKIELLKEQSLLLKQSQEKIKQDIKKQTNSKKIFAYVREVSAYNVGDIKQCAGNPCISANGENICNALEKGYKRCAANFVPFGTVLHIENFGKYLVTDRLNFRYKHRVDIAMKFNEKEKAILFGIKLLKISIIQ